MFNNQRYLILGILLSILLIMGLGLGCDSGTVEEVEESAEEAIESTEKGVKEVEIYTFFSGTSVYSVGVAMQEMINEQSDFLRATTIEGKSAMANIEMLLQEEDRKGNTIIWANPADLWELREGLEPYNQASNKIRPFVSNALIGQHLFTMDPDIKSLADLEGKTVAIGPGHLSTRVTFVKKLIEAAGVENVRYENLALDAQMQAMADGQVDATVANVYVYTASPFTFEFGNECVEVLSAHTVYPIPIDDEMINKAVDLMGETWPIIPIELAPYELLDTQDTPITIAAFPSTFSAHVDIDPDIVKEFMRIYFDNMDEFVDYHPVNIYIDENTAGLLTLEDEFIHPAGLEFMEEHGYQYYKNIEW